MELETLDDRDGKMGKETETETKDDDLMTSSTPVATGQKQPAVSLAGSPKCKRMSLILRHTREIWKCASA
ncbi:hypothetical protein ACLKA6_008315 [Drosophila palustris]